MIDPYLLPDGLPEPQDDGACDHLAGMEVPDLELPSTSESPISLAHRPRRSLVFGYPRSGRPGEPSLVADWDRIPGARGCTPEACGFRDHHTELSALGVGVFGLSTQSTADQAEFAERLGLPFPLLSDQRLELTHALALPAFEAAGETLIKRLTLLIDSARIRKVWYPVFPPDRHAAEVIAWLEANPRR